MLARRCLVIIAAWISVGPLALDLQAQALNAPWLQGPRVGVTASRSDRQLTPRRLETATLQGEEPAQTVEPKAQDKTPAWRPIQSIPGWTQENWREFQSEQQWPSNHPMLLNLLSRLNNIAPRNWERYVAETSEVALGQRNLDIAQWNGHVFELRGRVRSVRRFTLPAEIASNYLFDDYLIAEVVDDSGQIHRVVSLQFPTIWSRVSEENPVKVRGPALLVKQFPRRDQLLFVAPGLPWFPDHTDAALGIRPEHVWLADRKVNCALTQRLDFDSTIAIEKEESDLAMQLLRAVDEAEVPGDLTPSQPDLRRWLKEPQEVFGELYNVQGQARRVTRVAVESDWLREHYGIDHYYQLDVVVPAPTIKMLDQQGQPILDQDGEPFTYGERYAINVLCTQLPPPLQLPKGQLAHEVDLAVVIPAFFFKTWQHRNVRTRSVSKDLYKKTPILVGFQPIQPVPEERSSLVLAVGVIVLLGLLGLFAALVWRGARKERLNRQRRAALDALDIDLENVWDED